MTQMTDMLGVDLELHEKLQRTWQDPPGVWGWLTTTNHKRIGLRFIMTAMTVFVLAGLMALTMRLQLAVPRNGLVGPDMYNQLFTTHGSAMMFLFAVPIMEGFGLYFVPLMVGTRNVAFPKLMNFGYWVYLASVLLLFIGFALNIGPDAGWFAYVPLSGPQYSPGRRMDFWSQMVTLSELAALVGAVEIITTVFKQRVPGMSLQRIPLFVWAQVVTSFMVIFAMPSVMLGSSMLSMDRLTHVSTHFYNPAEGGDALLWQHLFWFFAHPEVYIIFIPATGFVSTIIPTFSRNRMFGYTAGVLALISIAFIGFGVWVHHMFATPVPELGQGMFTAASMLITIPSGIQIFCWIATMWGGQRIVFATPMLFVLGFIATFVIGGLTGVILASVSLDLQVHDTFFVVAHLHYVLIGGAVFPLLGALHYWFPKWTGRMLSETLGRLTFVLVFVGFHLTFGPMHFLGVRGMTRRIYTYVPETGWGTLNMLATIGAFTLASGVLVYVVNVLWSRRRGVVAGPNPWGASTLEWATTSPPANYNFATPPAVQGRDPIWDNRPDAPVVTGLSSEYREVLCTTTLDARPDHRYHLMGSSIWPLMLAIATAGSFIGVIFHPWAIPIGIAATAIALTMWFWPALEPPAVAAANGTRTSKTKEDA